MKLVTKIKQHLLNIFNYQIYCLKNNLSSAEKTKQSACKHAYSPLISIVIPLYNTKPLFFHQLMRTLQKQTYTNWEVCMCDGSITPTIRKIAEKYQERLGNRFKITYPGENLGISGNTNEAIKLATGDFIGFMDHDDILAENALHEIVSALNDNPDTEFLYTDEDKIDSNGLFHTNAFFKPAYSPDTLRSVNYICHFFVASKKLLDSTGYCRSEYDGSQDYDLILRLTEKSKKTVHIPRVLYHWRKHSLSTASNVTAKPYVIDAAKWAITDHLNRIGLNGTVETTINQMYRVTYNITDNPKVSIIILNKNSKEILHQCVNSIFNKSTYTNFEIIIVENNSSDADIFEYYKELSTDKRIVIKYWDKAFNFSALCNFGAKDCNSPYLLFLNNDTEVISPDWIEKMIEHLQHDSIGIVGAKLLYPDNTIQHAGVVIGIGDTAGHPFLRKNEKESGYKNALHTIRNVSAVTGACLMIKKDIFDSVGNFDEEYPVAYSDIDLCLKVLSAGYFNILTPYAVLYHYESYSRGKNVTAEKLIEMTKETDLFKTKWGNIIESGDFFYNPNLSTISHRNYMVNPNNHNFKPRVYIKRT